MRWFDQAIEWVKQHNPFSDQNNNMAGYDYYQSDENFTQASIGTPEWSDVQYPPYEVASRDNEPQNVRTSEQIAAGEEQERIARGENLSQTRMISSQDAGNGTKGNVSGDILIDTFRESQNLAAKNPDWTPQQAYDEEIRQIKEKKWDADYREFSQYMADSGTLQQLQQRIADNEGVITKFRDSGIPVDEHLDYLIKYLSSKQGDVALDLTGGWNSSITPAELGQRVNEFVEKITSNGVAGGSVDRPDDFTLTDAVDSGCEWAYNPIIGFYRTKAGIPHYEDLGRFEKQLRVVGGFYGGELDALKSAAEGLYSLGRHPIDTTKNIWQATIHPVDTGKAIYNSISSSYTENVINGDANTKARFWGRAVGEVGLAFIGTKGFDKAAKIARVGEETAGAANLLVRSRNPLEKIAEAESIATQGLSKAKLLGELEQAGVKYNKDAIVGIVKNPEGKLTWLETGNEAAGLKHVVARHSQEFSSWGLKSEEEIGKLILNAVEQGGGKSLGNGVTIYDVTINGISKQLKVVTGDNGFIVTAHPYSM